MREGGETPGARFTAFIFRQRCYPLVVSGARQKILQEDKAAVAGEDEKYNGDDVPLK
jgi:hypothetical protein